MVFQSIAAPDTALGQRTSVSIHGPDWSIQAWPVTQKPLCDNTFGLLDPTAFYTPGHVPPTLRVVPRPAEPLWELRKDHVTYTCELRYHGEWGVEAQIFHDGDFRVSWRYQTRAQAVAWAEGERRDIEAGRYADAAPDDIVF
jgi:hypothetical protein